MPPQGCCHGIVPKKAHAEQAFDDAIVLAIVKVNAPWDSALLCSPHAYLVQHLDLLFFTRSRSHTCHLACHRLLMTFS
jgi:hypothetical protein